MSRRRRQSRIMRGDPDCLEKNDFEANKNNEQENKQINNYLSKWIRDNKYKLEHLRVKEGFRLVMVIFKEKGMPKETIDEKDMMKKCMMTHLGPERNVVQKKAVKNIMTKKIDENINESPLP